MTEAFAWLKRQKYHIKSINKRIIQMEKTGKGANVMELKLSLKKLKRRMELDKDKTKTRQMIRKEINNIV